MSATATRAPRLRLSRDTIRRLTVSPRAMVTGPVPPTTGGPTTAECEITYGCTHFGNCAPSYPNLCDTTF